MTFFIIIIAIGLLIIWGDENPLHSDRWFSRWSLFIEQRFAHTSSEKRAFYSIGAPVAAVIIPLILIQLPPLSGLFWLYYPISAVVLLYSFGRSEFSHIVTAYTHACSEMNWSSALLRAQELGVSTDDLNTNDWEKLHQHVLSEASYRGFERLFAALFWFIIIGPAGALLYRLLFIYTHQHANNPEMQKGLWIMEWPAARLLGITLAFTGNFAGCYRRWRECLLCAKRSTAEVLSLSVIGALSIQDSQTSSAEITRQELCLLNKLYLRTLWFWLAGIAVLILMQ